MKACVLGLDIGTTCAKAVVVEESGKVVSQGSAAYPLISDGVKIEQRAQDWIRGGSEAAKQALEQAEGFEVIAVSLSTQGASTVALDREGHFIGNSWTWMDGRSEPEMKEVVRLLGEDYLYKASGWGPGAALDSAKIRRMKKEEQFRDAVKYLSTLEVLNQYLTGNQIIDPTNAAIRQLFCVEKNQWDQKLMDAAGVSVQELPEVRPTGAKVGELTAAAAKELGLRQGIPVFNGAHDQYCASIGAGAVNEGDMLLSAGTAWVIMGISRQPLFTKTFIAPGKHPVEGLYGNIISLICAGASLQWLKNQFIPEDFQQMNKEAAGRREKCRDLFFYPYLAGDVYPLRGVNAKGAFTGVTLEHDRFDFARAVMEGVVFGLRRAVDDFKANGTQIRYITAMGGASKSPLWMQMISSITDVAIRQLDQADVCALGAAAIAACGVGMFSDYEAAAKAMTHPEKTYTPIAEEREFYTEKFKKYDRMWKIMEKYYQE